MIYDLLRAGGMATIVIVVAGLFAFVVFVERIYFFHRAQIRVSDFLNGIFNVLRQGNRREAIILCEETPGPVAVIAKTAIIHFSDTPEELKKAIFNTGVEEASRMERKFTIISSVAHLAPLFGLFGTIVGLMEYAFIIKDGSILIEVGQLTSGIFTALVSTATGLCVAILSSIEYNLLISRMDVIVGDMERTGQDVETFIINLRKS